ncbi:MAG: hypothetical protein ABIK08_04555 [Pseudomonadota bacterium]
MKQHHETDTTAEFIFEFPPGVVPDTPPLLTVTTPDGAETEIAAQQLDATRYSAMYEVPAAAGTYQGAWRSTALIEGTRRPFVTPFLFEVELSVGGLPYTPRQH